MNINHDRYNIKDNKHNYETTFLLGAEASFGHILDNSKTPPIMKKFLSSSVERDILTEAEFPDLVDYIKKIRLIRISLKPAKISNLNLIWKGF